MLLMLIRNEKEGTMSVKDFLEYTMKGWHCNLLYKDATPLKVFFYVVMDKMK